MCAIENCSNTKNNSASSQYNPALSKVQDIIMTSCTLANNLHVQNTKYLIKQIYLYFWNIKELLDLQCVISIILYTKLR
jgi:urate oxidase